MKIETQGFCSTRLRLSDLKVNHDCMRCPGTVHQNVVVCDNVWPRQRSPPKKPCFSHLFTLRRYKATKKSKKVGPTTGCHSGCKALVILVSNVVTSAILRRSCSTSACRFSRALETSSRMAKESAQHQTFRIIL